VILELQCCEVIVVVSAAACLTLVANSSCLLAGTSLSGCGLVRLDDHLETLPTTGQPTDNTLHTHTHTHLFHGPLSRTTWVSQDQKGKTNLDFTEARDI